jgi:hypothetical protein
MWEISLYNLENTSIFNEILQKKTNHKLIKKTIGRNKTEHKQGDETLTEEGGVGVRGDGADKALA